MLNKLSFFNMIGGDKQTDADIKNKIDELDVDTLEFLLGKKSVNDKNTY